MTNRQKIKRQNRLEMLTCIAAAVFAATVAALLVMGALV